MMYMSFLIDEQSQKVTFLYKLLPGTCPESYGMNVARMALVPEEIVEVARKISDDFTKAQEQKRIVKNGVELTKIALFTQLMQDGIDDDKMARIWKSLQ